MWYRGSDLYMDSIDVRECNAVRLCHKHVTFVAEMQQPNAAPHCVEFWSVCSMSILCSQIYIFKDVSGMGLIYVACVFSEAKWSVQFGFGMKNKQQNSWRKSVMRRLGSTSWEPGEGMDPFTGPVFRQLVIGLGEFSNSSETCLKCVSVCVCVSLPWSKLTIVWLEWLEWH